MYIGNFGKYFVQHHFLGRLKASDGLKFGSGQRGLPMQAAAGFDLADLAVGQIHGGERAAP